MTRQSVQAFAGGMILATAVLAGAFYLTDNGKAEASKDAQNVSEADVKTYLKDNQQVSLKREEYQQLLHYKETALKQDATSQNKKEKEQDDAKKGSKYKLEIKSGMSTAEIADLLEKGKVISSADDFKDYVKKTGNESKIRAGKYELKRGDSLKNIVKTLSK
ncbi:endolytic transglycosylase MltG [Bacillus haynesii]|uniref:Endolytic transglycosylase MltG n=1 Tax=Bacillus haynesii TaxID=1925021 RepID=A0AA90EP12_9BACI|nr:endolytic transglycosylase MltG [Bacillus haynesii]MCY7792721.1 endolytic transglycosylase MltG [Bacillus haynesii]MCY7848992.1 endolytic transglycosylase MltG [Bacillus haynesii]MCY7860092.1 endolytic transglycosylase MltG [Bacillus haynesii]MCY7914863.1 endolytic transglycosylase MltG [Bacillus haynesii]MCY7926501.1 endolytic transglycosylase MltG [Bacillus haynesii]